MTEISWDLVLPPPPPPLKSFLLLSELKIIGMLLNVVIGQILKSLQKHITEKSVRASSPLSFIDYAVTRIIFYIARYRTKCKRLEREAEQGLQVHEPVVGTSVCLFVCLFAWLVGWLVMCLFRGSTISSASPSNPFPSPIYF